VANDLQTLRDVRDLLALRAGQGTRPGSLAEAMHVIDLMLMEAKSALAAPVADPCPQCVPGGVCRTPTCGRLRRRQAAAPRQQLDIDGIAGDVAAAIKAQDPIAMGGGHAAHLAAIKELVRDAIIAALPEEPSE